MIVVYVLVPNLILHADRGPVKIWILGDSHIEWVAHHAVTRQEDQLGLNPLNYHITWKGVRGAKLGSAVQLLNDLISEKSEMPNILIVHLGSNDLVDNTTLGLHLHVKSLITHIQENLPQTQIIWSCILPRPVHDSESHDQRGTRLRFKYINREASNMFHKAGGRSIAYPDIFPSNKWFFCQDLFHLSTVGLEIFINTLKGALEYFHWNQSQVAYPPPED